MPFVSQAQWNKFGELRDQGKITKATFDEWANSSPAYHTLPKRKGEQPAAAPTEPRVRNNIRPVEMRGRKK